MKLKNIIPLCLLLITITAATVGAAPADASALRTQIEAFTMATIDGDVVRFSPFEYGGNIIKFYPESNITKDEALVKYNSAYTFITNALMDSGIDADLENEEFQNAVKSFFLIELDDKALEKEVREFAQFMDFYENKNDNAKIMGLLRNRTLDEQELNAALPANESASTSEGSVESPSKPIITTFAYSGTTAATYATTWWNKTNNTDFPYYASYYNQSTTNNNLNDLPSGATGQSNPRRGWNDCTNFVSQAIYKGGISTKKSGILNPHSSDSNWYYDNSKPSFTWGGAHNFYSHFSSRAGVAASSADLQVGDVVSVDFTGDGSIDHTIIITRTTGTYTNQQFVTYHTTDTNQTRDLKYFYDYNTNVKLYGYEMDKVS